MASSIPKEVKKEVVDTWIAETWKVALFTTLQTASLYSSCTNEVVGTGYTAGGATVTKSDWGVGSDYVDTTNAKIDATDSTWTSATFTARCAVVYNTTTSKIRAIYDFAADKVVTGGTFTIQWNAGGLIKIS